MNRSPMTRRERSIRRRRRVVAIDILAIALAVVGLACVANARLAVEGTPPVHLSGALPLTASSVQGSITRSVPSPSAAAHHKHFDMFAKRTALPAQLLIPSIDVQSQLIRLGLESDGTLQVPTDASVAGWYALGPRPGDPGASIIAGHVDSMQGSAVFYRLGELSAGSLIRVDLADGTEVRFRVYAVREFAKTGFPTPLVYGSTRAPELRLITCGGPFDSQIGHYLDNVVVFARFAGRTAPARSRTVDRP